MNKKIRTWGCVFSMWLGLISGCATAPTEKMQSENAELLYDGEAEVLYEAKEKAKTADEAIEFGEQALKVGDIDRALYHFVSAYEFDKSRYSALYKVGIIHAKKGSIDRASLAFNLVLRENPEHAETLLELGLIGLRLRRRAEAENHLRRAVEMGAEPWRAYNGLAVLADLRKDFAAANEYYVKALELNPESPVILNNHGYSKYLAGDWEGARESIRRALDIDVGYQKAWLNLALILVRSEAYDQAVAAFERFMERAQAYERLGTLVMMEGKYDVAEYFLNLAIDESPTYYKPAYDRLEELQGLRGKSNEQGLVQVTKPKSADWGVFELAPVYVRPSN